MVGKERRLFGNRRLRHFANSIRVLLLFIWPHVFTFPANDLVSFDFYWSFHNTFTVGKSMTVKLFVYPWIIQSSWHFRTQPIHFVRTSINICADFNDFTINVKFSWFVREVLLSIEHFILWKWGCLHFYIHNFDI